MNIDFRSLSVGDPVPPAMPDTAIFVQGAPRWHALRVAPQREDQAEAWLGRRGVYAFHPVEVCESRKKGRVRQYQRRYVPGYVFAKFPGEARVDRVLSCAFIVGAVCLRTGDWGILHSEELRALHRMRKIDASILAAEDLRRIRRRRQMALKVGDRAKIRLGPMADFPCEVVALKTDGAATLRVRLFGRELLTDGHVDNLDREACGY